MKKTTVILTIAMVLFSAIARPQHHPIILSGNAPVTIAPQIIADPNTTINVPIRVVNFNNIGVISLTLHYTGTVLNLVGFTVTSGMSNLFVHQPVSGTVTVAGFTSASSGITLPDSAILFTMHFAYAGGYTDLAWFDNGTSCEYGGPPPDYNVLNDIPQEEYYIDGYVSQPGFITLNCPDDIEVSTDPGLCSALLSFAADAGGTPPPTITYSIEGIIIESPYSFPAGSYKVDVTASNGIGMANCSFNVTVNDNEAPSLIDPLISCSSLDQNNILLSLPEAENFDAAMLEADVAALYHDNCGGLVTAFLNNTVAGDNNSNESWLFEYEYRIEDANGNFTHCMVTYSGSLWPAHINLVGETVGDTGCYGATETIVVENLTVLPGGSITLIAGQSIHLLPGILAGSGGHLHAYISDILCANPMPLVAVAVKEEYFIPDQTLTAINKPLFRIFPNPGNGIFSLDLMQADANRMVTVEIFNLMGEKLMMLELSGQMQHTFDLSAWPNGIYFMRTAFQGKSDVYKIIIGAR
jgi:hypothetical protein